MAGYAAGARRLRGSIAAACFKQCPNLKNAGENNVFSAPGPTCIGASKFRQSGMKERSFFPNGLVAPLQKHDQISEQGYSGSAFCKHVHR